MIDSARLLKDLQKQVTEVEKDLRGQLGRLPEVRQRLAAEHSNAFKVGRTSSAAPQWVEERVTQASVAWVLGTVFVRFSEDNFLLKDPYIAGTGTSRQTHAHERHDHFIAEAAERTHRHWLWKAFDEIGSSPAGRSLFDKKHNPLFQIPLSNEGAKGLIDFWRRHEESGSDGTSIVHDFSDPEWNTRFLGDLYQDLSQEAKDKYALLQTPKFVEEFILQRTLNKALNRFGYDVVKMIDPTCGSGHFLLGAFQRILEVWEEKAPSDDVHKRVEGALNAVHGVDINPFAVAIARFRLVIAALKAADVKNFQQAAGHEWPLHVAAGDALLKGSQEKIFDLNGAGMQGEEGGSEFLFETEDVTEHLDILKPGQYHVVVGNPPYIAVKDSSLRDTYRRLYRNVCHGKYVLSVPFMQRFFELAIRDDEGNVESGYVGQITSNSFMKREFGEKLVQGYLKNAVDLIEVIDSSGAYIPGHGTPTVIVVGRNRLARLGAKTVRVVRGVQGEPEVPKNSRHGRVWQDILERIDAPGKSVGAWISVDNVNREDYFGKHPWILADGGVETIREIDANSIGGLKKTLAAKAGIAAVTGEDDLYLFPRSGSLERLRINHARALLSGDSVRDHQALTEFDALWTYDDDFEVLSESKLGAANRILWAGKGVIRKRKRFGTPMVDRGLSWYEWQELYSGKLRTELSICFAEVATHNHFVLDRGGKVFNRTAPVIKLPEGAMEEDYLKLVGPLNSSTACFWLKQMCHSKGSTVDTKGARQSKAPFDDFYQFNATNVQEFPLPSTYPLTRATELDTLAQQLTATSPTALATDPEKPPTASTLLEAKKEWHRIRARMIAVQEELDWEVYGIYGLHADLTAPEDSLPPNGLALGQRAFEIDLGDRVEKGETKTEWFRRHKSTMISEIPADAEWPEAYKDTVRRRLDAMRSSAVIGLIERPEYKRRWLTDGWDKQQEAALREWLLARMERRELWYETDSRGVERPRTRSIRELVDDLAADSDFMDVAALYAPGKELTEIVPELVEDQHVPFLAALRYQEPVLKNKRYVWEEVWRLQRAEDEAMAAKDFEKVLEIRKQTPVPPKYVTKDFLQASYAAQRGGLDVPKERFISYSRSLSPAIEVLGWGGWDHEEQAVALTETIAAREESGNWEREDFIPYLAGLQELLFWVEQWHPDEAGVYQEALADWQHEDMFAVTTEELRAWRPAKKAAKRAVRSAAGKTASA
ncbi:BREX-2 system adenine-specific DNA-methyltransferase PglX [Streptomyces europaeiscabiei]|uniref:site-specific DNA-methyltransferase (adenine-specific) n=1 Tax=Streptomyces europaeiscabiei TaxID=146819 RepID=A0ABU4NN99_9ACTN|nr:BREX-2 system adenine-specific DNA-methyltransferase PglX [Streptomyces europaeiscabiei]MDX3547189.1 BREX-2 system adenine-specific DNA-methyltransferase PglX [Streptomyces europaeiscabiei]MDX3704598.1 BREX-2 system adenine-specific DNA-methyltransferase PglX [Streptomyces europaeiscabiei]